MKLKYLGLILPIVLLAALALGASSRQEPQPVAKAITEPITDMEKDRSPMDVVLTPDGKFAVTANRTAGTVSLVDLVAGKVVSEVATDREPFALAMSGDGKTVAVTNYDAGTLSFLTVETTKEATRLRLEKTMLVGQEPRGVALTRDGNTAYVALAGEDAIAKINVGDKMRPKYILRFATEAEPWYVALTPNDERLAVGCTRGKKVQIFDAKLGKQEFEVNILGHNLRRFAVSNDGTFAYMPGIGERGMGTQKEHIDRGWVISNRLNRVVINGGGPREAITLDIKSDAVGDVDGVALAPNGKNICLTAGGTHELLLFNDATKLPYEGYGGPGDHIDDVSRAALRRVDLGGRPTGVQFTPDGKTLVVANYFGNSLQIVDHATAKLTKVISLGGPKTPSPARQGEMLFHDAKRSFGNWYSCNSCHTEGHTNGSKFDTQNDGSFGKPKKVLSLRGVTQTSPWTWHGWQKSLDSAISESFVHSMQGNEPTKDEVAATRAYLETLTWRKGTPSDAASVRGEKVFKAKNCGSCHDPAKNFSTDSIVQAGLEKVDDFYKGYNPPTLRGVGTRAPYLHDGRAKDLEDVLTEHHTPSKLTGASNCTPQELKDIIAYLNSL
jgi:DNA-binding beta-propeller fold protein YncE